MRGRTTDELRRKGAAFCLLAAPLLMLAGDALHVFAGMRWAWAVMFKLSFAFFVGAALAAARLTGERAGVAGLVGAALVVVGALAGASIVTANAVLGSVESAALGEAAGRAIEAAFARDGVGGYLFLYPLPGLAFPAGFLVLAYALWRGRVVSPAPAAALAAGALLFPVGRIGGVEWAVIASGAGMTLGLGAAALGALRLKAAGGRALPATSEAPAT